MEKRLKLPVGIDGFEKIRRNGFYYIDKTKLIEQLFSNWGKVNLFTRPRRFGKTLNMNMLKCFFEIGTDPSLFDELYITENEELCKQHQGQYPVIFLSLKRSLYNFLKNTYLKNRILFKTLSVCEIIRP